MKRIILFVALVFFQLSVINPSYVLAEGTDENRTVADLLEEEPIQEEQLEGSSGEIEEEVFAAQNPFFLFFQLFGALLFVIILIYIFLRFVNNRTRSYRSNQVLQNLGGVSLGSNRSVQLVKVGDRLFVVGVGETIQLLKEIEQEDEIDQLLKQQEEQMEKMEVPIVKFFQKLKSNKRENDEDLDFHDVFKARLERMKDSQEEIRETIRERDK